MPLVNPYMYIPLSIHILFSNGVVVPAVAVLVDAIVDVVRLLVVESVALVVAVVNVVGLFVVVEKSKHLAMTEGKFTV